MSTKMTHGSGLTEWIDHSVILQYEHFKNILKLVESKGLDLPSENPSDWSIYLGGILHEIFQHGDPENKVRSRVEFSTYTMHTL